MSTALLVALTLHVAGLAWWGRMVRPQWKLLGKTVFYLGVSAALDLWVGPWALVFIVGHPLLGLAGHVWICRTHGINVLTCEPRQRYLDLQTSWARARDADGS
ncbi:MAG: hypothetical protein K0V04_11975 [Deltaproteobacteria bacterium]|nr:hypothetical protein [Deltaproteobacteria bacterium]